jgi:hypothetical protein
LFVVFLYKPTHQNAVEWKRWNARESAALCRRGVEKIQHGGLQAFFTDLSPAEEIDDKLPHRQ